MIIKEDNKKRSHMNKLKKRISKVLAGILVLCTPALAKGQTGTSNSSYVVPSIGGVGLILQPTRPTVQIPNQMVRVYPVRNDYLDDQIKYFPLTLISHRLGELFGIMPFTGQLLANKEPVSAWDQQLETSTPYYYSVWLEDYSTTLEFAPGSKTGYFKITFPKGSLKNIFVKNVNEGTWKQVSSTVITGVEFFNGMKAYTYGEFNVPATFTEVAGGRKNRQAAIVSWPENSIETIEFKYAISFISQEQAEKNLKNEIKGWTFDAVKENARAAWDKVFGQIEVEGGTDARRRSFYTALYRCYERMVNITEDGQYYSNYDGKIHTDARTFYVDDWTWDTYLALHPLRAIFNREMESDMVASYVRMYEQSGWVPTFPVLWGDHACMNGFHSTIMMLDDYRKGIRNFDVNKAYEGMKKNALQATMLPWRNGPMCSLDTFYHKNGYYPGLHPDEKETVSLVNPSERRQSVALTLGHSYDDWALAQMAKELGKKDDYAAFMNTSANYKNLYWKEKGFFMPKDANGKWIDIDPKFDGGRGGRDYYDENNGWTYLWQVQHDVSGLIGLMGGKSVFESRLDQLFREGLGRGKSELWAKFPDFTGIVGQYSMGNEPSFHIPYLYNFTDAPWKTQKKIRLLLNTWFTDNDFGIPGDEDGGGMSAFVVFSSMGFYPVVPGLPVYTIGSPVFDKITLHLSKSKTFTVLAPNCNETNKYIQEAYLNGKPLSGPWFTHEDLMKGGELKLVMGAYPNKTWGVDSTLLQDLLKAQGM